jgi:hypothetical protein
MRVAFEMGLGCLCWGAVAVLLVCLLHQYCVLGLGENGEAVACTIAALSGGFVAGLVWGRDI